MDLHCTKIRRVAKQAARCLVHLMAEGWNGMFELVLALRGKAASSESPTPGQVIILMAAKL